MKKNKIIILVVVIVVAAVASFMQMGNRVESVSEVEYEDIQAYLERIYGLFRPLPEFNKINEAREDWAWEMVLDYLLDTNEVVSGYTAAEVEAAAKTLFGEDFKKKISEDSSRFIGYDEVEKKYWLAAMGIETHYCFVVKDMTKRGNKYTINIVEYVRSFDYVGDIGARSMCEIVYNSKDEVMTTYIRKYTSASNDEEMQKMYDESAAIDAQFVDFVLNNADKFNSKEVVVEKDKKTGLLHIVSSKNN